MPVRRRKTKRRLTPEAEMKVWSAVFECRYDFFGEVAEMTGLVEPTKVWPLEARPEVERQWTAAAREAWTRLGALFLDARSNDNNSVRGRPWAVKAFGDPRDGFED